MSNTVPESFTAALASPHTLATEAGMRAYRDGGNAIDAAIAAAAVLTVVYPHNVALGGDLVALVRTPDGRVRCINASGWAGAAVDTADLRARFATALPIRGPHSITVPGGVRGWESLRRIGARLPWGVTLRDAQRHAESGSPVARSLAAHLRDPENNDLFGTADFDRVFRPRGRCLQAGQNFVQPALAQTFAALSADGANSFYDGTLTESMLSFLRGRGSALTAADFATYEPEVVEPLTLSFRGLTVLTSPPNTQGFILLRALSAIENVALTDPLGNELGTLLRIFQHSNLLRAEHLADPRTVPVDVAALVHDNLEAFTHLEPRPEPETVLVPHGDTVGVAAADSDGYAVSLVQSVFHAFGSGMIDPHTGVLFHNRGSSFVLNESSPNVIAPRKRPAHTLMPAMTTQGGAIRHAFATMGGQGQPQIITQVLLRVMAGEELGSAIAAPRAIVGHQVDGATASSALIESDLGRLARESIAQEELLARFTPAHTESLGQTNAVVANPEGSLTAAADPRADGAGVVAHYPRYRAR